MNSLLEDVGWRACTSAYRLDRWRLGELGPDEAAEVESHVGACPRCGDAAAALVRAEAEFRSSAAPPFTGRTAAATAPPPARRRRAPAWLLPGMGAAFAATVLLVLQGGESIRSKGAPAEVGMYVQHQGTVRRAGWGEVVQPGDSVRFTYSVGRPSEVAILSLDGAGAASVYFPEGEETVRVEAAHDSPLPLGTRLDGVLGEEQVVALFCDRRHPLEPLRRALEAAAPALPDVPGCQRATFRFTKRAGP
ncbi:MAG TPA: zf-HC2 domain-containing protein [Myxococcaceae bacterium]|nr:zf-HC2 domain-containing protein [Myxococcaceae bacterium]